MIVAYAFARSVSDVATGRTVALVVLVLTGLYLVLLLEDEAMQESKVRARSVLMLMALLLVGLRRRVPDRSRSATSSRWSRSARPRS